MKSDKIYTMTNNTLEDALKQLKESTTAEIKLPSGESVKTETNKLVTPSSVSSDQMKEMKNIPTVVLPDDEDEREE